MRQTTTPRILLALLLAATSTAAFAAKAHKFPLPKNPAALLALAARHNGLTGPHLKPWHIKATYQLYNAKGKPTETGTFEEWWAAPNKYKAIFKRGKSTTTLYVSPKGAYIAGPIFGDAGFNILRWIVEPIPDQGHLPGAKLREDSRSSGQTKLVCVTVHPTEREVRKENLRTAAYCFDRNRPVLRAAQAQFNDEALYEKLAHLEGRYIGDQVNFTRGKNLVETVHILSGEVIPTMSPSLTNMPPEAAGHTHPISHHFSKDFLIHPGKRIGGQPPAYPFIARSTGTQGVVRLRGSIETNGTVHDLKVISSPSPAFSRSALQAVHTWRYIPYTFAGRPIKIRTEIDVAFSLGTGM